MKGRRTSPMQTVLVVFLAAAAATASASATSAQLHLGLTPADAAQVEALTSKSPEDCVALKHVCVATLDEIIAAHRNSTSAEAAGCSAQKEEAATAYAGAVANASETASLRMEGIQKAHDAKVSAAEAAMLGELAPLRARAARLAEGEEATNASRASAESAFARAVEFHSKEMEFVAAALVGAAEKRNASAALLAAERATEEGDSRAAHNSSVRDAAAAHGRQTALCQKGYTAMMGMLVHDGDVVAQISKLAAQLNLCQKPGSDKKGTAKVGAGAAETAFLEEDQDCERKRDEFMRLKAVQEVREKECVCVCEKERERDRRGKMLVEKARGGGEPMAECVGCKLTFWAAGMGARVRGCAGRGA